MAPTGKPRAKGANVEDWWMIMVRKIVEGRKEDLGETLSDLGVALAEAVGRDEAWNHGSVSRFLGERNITADMAAAFSKLFGIPQPFFSARSEEEALALQQVSRRYDDKPLNPDQKQRRGELDQALDAAEVEVRGQSSGVVSTDEARGGGRGSRGGRAGRADRGRS